jgi:hypothetical protein
MPCGLSVSLSRPYALSSSALVSDCHLWTAAQRAVIMLLVLRKDRPHEGNYYDHCPGSMEESSHVIMQTATKVIARPRE